MKTIFAQLLILLATGSALVAEPGKPTSYYSNTNTKNVAVLESSELEKDPEIDYFTELCPGYGGYELIHHGGDLRSIVDIKYGKTISDLYAETMKHAPGSFAHKANDVVEWRGVLDGKNFTPHAIIYRFAGSTEPDDSGKQVTKTTLVVIALNKGEAKVLGSFSGKGEEAKARALADSVLKSKK